MASLAACVLPPPPTGQPVSPPPEVLNSPLMDNRWRVEDVTLYGEAVTFDIVAPIHIHFSLGGSLSIYPQRCPGSAGGYSVFYQGKQRYQLADGIFALEDCGARILGDDPTIDCAQLVGSGASHQACTQAINAQLGDVNRVLAATNEYELRGEELILRGEGVEMRLVLDNP